MAFRIVLLLLFCAVARAHQTSTQQTASRFVTRSVSTVLAEHRMVFAASTCGHLLGDAVNTTLILNNNPEWNPVKGVVYFYVTDDLAKSENDALCHNHPDGGDAVPSCTVPHWSSTKDLYVVTTAGKVSAVSFSVNVQFKPVTIIRKYSSGKPHVQRDPDIIFPRLSEDIYYLSEIAQISTTQQLLYQEQILLDVSFCANPLTTDNYMIRSTVFGTDDISSFTQHICDQSDCTIEGDNVIGYNGNQLPSNTVDIVNQHGQYEHLFVLLTCWGGNYNPEKKAYECNYQYTANIKSK